MRLWIAALTLALLTLVEGQALAPPQYLQIPTSEKPSSLAANAAGKVLLSFQEKKMLSIYDENTAAYVEITIKDKAGAIAIDLQNAYAAMPDSGELAVVKLSTYSVSYRQLGFRPADMQVNGDMLLIADPDGGRLVAFSTHSLEEAGAYSLAIADGVRVFSASRETVWAIDWSYSQALRLRLDTGEQKAVQLGAVATAIVALEDGEAWVATAGSELLKVSADSQVKNRVSLPKGTVISPPLIISAHGTLVYFSHTRNIVGELVDGSITETQLRQVSPTSPSAGADYKIWFIDSSSGRVGYVSTSRPPVASNIRVEVLPDGTIQVTAVVTDPDDDLDVDRLELLVLDYRGVFLDINQTFPLEAMGDGAFRGLYRPRTSEGRVELSLVLRDTAGNVVVKEVGKVSTPVNTGTATTSVITTVTDTGTGVEIGPIPILSLGLELLLLLPLVVVVTYFLIRRPRKRKRR